MQKKEKVTLGGSMNKLYSDQGCETCALKIVGQSCNDTWMQNIFNTTNDKRTLYFCKFNEIRVGTRYVIKCNLKFF
jgi:hypothetical protein